MTGDGGSPFAGRSALVTGAGRGIGQAIARRLAGEGARVLCVARTAAQLDATVRDTPGASAWCGDITDADAPAALLRTVRERYGELDLLVHCAGVLTGGTVETLPTAEVERMFRVNLIAPVALTAIMLPTLRTTRGQVLFVNSSIVRAGNLAGRAIYAATRAALKSVADGVRDEANADGIRVVSVLPGTTATPGQEALFAAAGRPWRPERLLQPDDVAQIACAALGLPRTAEVTDLFVRPMLNG